MGAAYRDNNGSTVDQRIQNGKVVFNYTDSAGKQVSNFSVEVANGKVDP
jgi:hypothetical protein